VTLLMLDTDVSSYVIRRRPAAIAERFQQHAQQLCVSVMTAAELRFGAVKAGRADLTALVEAYLARVTILEWPDSATFLYARIRTKAGSSGIPIGNMDLLIASHALAEQATLVTNNLSRFARVPDLRVEQWSA
jgi:tRNA(fMet)-specific endonuclease VapC